MDQPVLHIGIFAAKFCNELGTDKTSICSPLSVEIVLALLALGCKNEAHAELLKALGIPDDEELRYFFGSLASMLKKDVKGATLNVATKVYLKKGAELKPGIEEDAKKVFQSSLDQLDFNDKKAAADIINTWVAKQTNNKITKIVSPAMMKEDTCMVLVNAIYFQGLWTIPFYKSGTRNRPFRVNENTTIQVPMMSLTDVYLDYAEVPELKATMLQMWYQGDKASMVIVLPDKIEGLSSVLQKLASGHNIMADIGTMVSIKVDVVIPKFKMETTINLKTLLPKLGIKSIFDENNANIDMLKSNELLCVSEAIQKALIIVDENGTEAAASSGMVEVRLSRIQKEYFTADRPFFYLLIASDIPVFTGVYAGSEYAQINPPETKRQKV